VNTFKSRLPVERQPLLREEDGLRSGKKITFAPGRRWPSLREEDDLLSEKKMTFSLRRR
jgi:hypothetical protein